MVQICVTSTLPSLDGVLASFAPMLTFPPLPYLNPLIIGLPCFPIPLFDKIRIPNLEMVMAAIELQSYQFQNMLFSMIKPMLDLLKIAIEDFLPEIPGLPGLTLLDLINGNTSAIINAITASILGGLTLPMIPSPLYQFLNIPQFQIIQTLQLVVANYTQMVANLIPNLIRRVIDKLKLRVTLPAFPVIPTPEALINSLMALIPPMPGIPENLRGFIQKIKALGGISIMSLMPLLSFNGMIPFPVLPNPLIPDHNLLEVELILALTAMQNNFLLSLLTPIKQAIDDFLSRKLSFSFPMLCITLSV